MYLPRTDEAHEAIATHLKEIRSHLVVIAVCAVIALVLLGAIATSIASVGEAIRALPMTTEEGR